MTSSPLTNHPTTSDTSLDSRLGIPELEIAIFSAADAKYAQVDFDASDVIELFKNKNCTGHMCFEIRQMFTTVGQCFRYRHPAKSGGHIIHLHK